MHRKCRRTRVCRHFIAQARIRPARKDFNKATYAAFLALFIFALSSFCLASELIEPTRTLQGGTEGRGRLVVFSEPPKLEVFLDGKSVGLTPLWLTQVKAGWHTVRIEGKENQFYLGRDKALELGLFKGSFITLPEKKEEHKAPQAVQQQAGSAAAQTEQPSEEAQRKKELSRWELYVNGSLRNF